MLALAPMLFHAAFAAKAPRARFDWDDGDAWRVEVVLERLVTERGAAVSAYKTLAAYDLNVTSDAGGRRIATTNARVVDAAGVHDAGGLEQLAIGAWAPFRVDARGVFLGLSSADGAGGLGTHGLASGAKRQWADLVESWIGRRFVPGTRSLTLPKADAATEIVALVPCGERSCVAVEREAHYAASAADSEVFAEPGAELLGWTDRVRVVFDPVGMHPHEARTERVMQLDLDPGDAVQVVERIDRSTRRFTRSDARTPP